MPADSTSPSVPDLQRRVDELAAELRACTSDHEEALRREAAIAEILQVTNASGGDLTLVLNAIIEKATRLCSAFYGYIWTYDGESARAVAAHGDARFEEWLLQGDPVRPSEQSPLGRVLRSGRLAHVVDAKEDETYRNEPRFRDLVDRAGLRTLLHIPLRKGDTLLGVITVYRRERQAFTEQQILLLESFAEQAVIAMENARLLDEQREALERQTAMAEVLQVINSSPGDLAPVFETILERATRLCEAAFGIMWRYDGDLISLGATHRVPQAFIDFASKPFRPAADSGPGRIMRGEGTFAVADMHEWEPYKAGGALPRAIGDLAGSRSFVIVPLRRGGVTLGSITLYRQEVRPFTPREISLVESFAAQAVIAMENARLLGELRTSLEQQTATSDVLKTISRSSVGLEAVLYTLVETVARLCRADHATMFRRRDELHHLVAAHGLPEEALEFMRTHPFEDSERTMNGRVVMRRQTVHIHDIQQDEGYAYGEGHKIAGMRTMLGIPLMAQDKMVGVFIVTRTRVEPFSEKEIELASGFADQAVIAIENARLFEELRDRQAELRVTFDNMGDGVAMFDAEPRLAAWNRNFERIIGLSDTVLAERPSYADYLRLLAERGEFGTENVEAELASRLENTARELRLERTHADGTVIEVRRNAVPGGGFVLIYSDVTEQRRAEAAIRAARDAAEAALERQTATADILKVIASSPTDVQPVLDAVVKAAVRFCGAEDAVINLREGDNVAGVAHEGQLSASVGRPRPVNRSSVGGRAIVDANTIHMPDILALDPEEFGQSRSLALEHEYRAATAAPMLREGIAIGSILLRKVEAGPFTPQQVALLQTFAAQAVIAIENVRLFTELRESLEQQTADR
jgi:PAS domain S-box-containing protein